MGSIVPPPINDVESSFIFKEWLNKLYMYVYGTVSSIPWANIDKTGSSLDDIETKNHSQLDNILGSSEGYHLSSTQLTDLTDSGATTLHKHSHSNLDSLNNDDHTQYVLADGSRTHDLDDLNNVDVTGKTDGQSIVWSSSTNKWNTATVTSGGGVTDHGA